MRANHVPRVRLGPSLSQTRANLPIKPPLNPDSCGFDWKPRPGLPPFRIPLLPAKFTFELTARGGRERKVPRGDADPVGWTVERQRSLRSMDRDDEEDGCHRASPDDATRTTHVSRLRWPQHRRKPPWWRTCCSQESWQSHAAS